MRNARDSEGRSWRIAANVVMILATAVCILPVLLLIMSSVTDESTIVRNGYSFFPAKFGSTAYDYLMVRKATILRAYGISAFVTVAGTCCGLLVMSMLAYPLSRKDLPHRRLLTFVVVFTMLFNGGLVPTYLLYTQILHIKNTIWALLVPNLLVGGFYVLMLKSFFSSSIPDAVIESAKLDGLDDFRMLFQIVYPLATPVLATVALLQGIAYWNDWFNGLIYLTDAKLFSIQNLLNRILMDVQFMASSTMGAEAVSAVASLPSVTVRMAIAVLGVLPMLIAYPFFQKHFVRGIAMGSVKG
jgi:ABC-type sugar transport system, permease component